jgi:hypothetical protein
MCLIAYVKAGSKIPETYFRSAAHDNDDGIGIMWRDGVEKFLGNKMVKRAWRLTKRLHEANAEFAVHFRYATHGRVALVNTHPFRTPDGNAYVMHNGILTDYTPKNAAGDVSDTRNLVQVMRGVDVAGDLQYWEKLEEHIGWGNKLCVMSREGDFRIVNDAAGEWLDGVWYSQTYSLPGQYGAGYYERKYGNWGNGICTAGTAWRGHGYSNTDMLDETEVGARSCVIQTNDKGTVATALIPYAARSALAAMKRHDQRDNLLYQAGKDYANGAGTHSLPADTYNVLPLYKAQNIAEAEALDRELDRHFAQGDGALGNDDDEPTDICPSCETMHSNGAMCLTCGHFDEHAGLLAAGMS